MRGVVKITCWTFPVVEYFFDHFLGLFRRSFGVIWTKNAELVPILASKGSQGKATKNNPLPGDPPDGFGGGASELALPKVPEASILKANAFES